MSVFAIGDLHLAHSTPEKNMAAFGPLWENYMERIEEGWRGVVTEEDLVLIPGDISWAMKLSQALIDLKWIDALPGTKLLLRGNHDYWWESNAKMATSLPPSLHFIHNTAFLWNEIAIGGTRLWDSDEYHFREFIHFQPTREAKEPPKAEESEKIFQRELQRLRLSLTQLHPQAKKRLAMTHYPPIGADLKPSKTSALLEEFQIDVCVFGHLHNLTKERSLFGSARGIDYLLTAADYINFKPVRII